MRRLRELLSVITGSLLVLCLAGHFVSTVSAAPAVLEKISLEHARRDGIPSPPYTVAVGKTWIHSVKSSLSGSSYLVYKIIDETDRTFTFTTDVLNADKKLTWSDKEIVNKDGTLYIDTNDTKFEWEGSGNLWPQGTVKTGDSWTSRLRMTGSSGVSEIETSYRVEGFENYNGHDCIVLEVTSDMSGSYSNEKGVSREYISYKDGVRVYTKKNAQSNRSGKYAIEHKLVKLEYK